MSKKQWESWWWLSLSATVAFTAGLVLAQLYDVLSVQRIAAATQFDVAIIALIYGYGMHLVPLPWTVFKMVSPRMAFDASEDFVKPSIVQSFRWLLVTGLAFGSGISTILGIAFLAAGSISAATLGVRMFIDHEHSKAVRKEGWPESGFDTNGFDPMMFNVGFWGKLHDWYVLGAVTVLLSSIVSTSIITLGKVGPLYCQEVVAYVYPAMFLAFVTRGTFLTDGGGGEQFRYVPVGMLGSAIIVGLMGKILLGNAALPWGLAFGAICSVGYWFMTVITSPDDDLV